MSDHSSGHGKPSGDSLPPRTAVIVAHPDDEIIALGGQLSQLEDITLVHVTDGAPLDMTDARKAGFVSRESYAAARARELDRALAASGVRNARCHELGIVDQEAAHHLADLVRVFITLLQGIDAVITHPYEGGHPDHDACAFAVQAACVLLWLTGRPAPQRVEFASYHASSGGIARGTFWRMPDSPERQITLDAAQQARKRAALAEFVTQRAVISAFPIDIERVRPAPGYNFTLPPPPREVLYDRFGWTMHSSLWRERALGAMRSLGLD
jgi:LmbE family N-acetylglucosaminyl deacetylase